jgi:pilus assembly protein CpaB
VPIIKTRLQAIFRPGLLLPLGATIAGVAAAASASNYLRDQAQLTERQIRQRYATQSVVVASRDLPKGQILDSTLLAVRSIPQAFLTQDAISPARASELIGGHTAISIRRGMPVALTALTTERAPTHLSETLSAGQRALTIQVDQVNAVGGHLGAGDTVDLYYSQREQATTVLVPLLENVHVLATGTATEQAREGEVSEEGFSTITVRLSAEQAARVVLAEQAGRVTVLLRASGDQAPTEVRTRSSQQLLSTSAYRASSSQKSEPLIELLTGGRGEVTPSRSWLKVGPRTALGPKEAM